jgi:hypothetical protein
MAMTVSQVDTGADEVSTNRAGMYPEVDADVPERFAASVEPSSLLDLGLIHGWVAALGCRPVQMLQHGRSVKVESDSQIVDRDTVGVGLNQVGDLGGFQTAKDPLRGSQNGPGRPWKVHLEDLTDTFSLFRMVQVTSQHLHRKVAGERG